MKFRFRILLTNWINIAGIFIAVYVAGIVSELMKVQAWSGVPDALTVGVMGGLIGIMLYGSIFWVGFIITMFLLDFVLVIHNGKRLWPKLTAEWMLVSSPFIYWFMEYQEWVFLVAVTAFAFSQFIRGKRILKIYTPVTQSAG